ncbi:hypothetical protein Tco_0964839 [Tanacetum coccineum]
MKAYNKALNREKKFKDQLKTQFLLEKQKLDVLEKEKDELTIKVSCLKDNLSKQTQEQESLIERYEKSCFLKKVVAKNPKLYNANYLCDNYVHVVVQDSHDTLKNAEKSRLKMKEKQTKEDVQKMKIQPINYTSVNSLYEKSVWRDLFAVAGLGHVVVVAAELSFFAGQEDTKFARRMGVLLQEMVAAYDDRVDFIRELEAVPGIAVAVNTTEFLNDTLWKDDRRIQSLSVTCGYHDVSCGCRITVMMEISEDLRLAREINALCARATAIVNKRESFVDELDMLAEGLCREKGVFIEKLKGNVDF